MALERRVEFTPAFDLRNEPGGRGQNCAMMHLAVGDARGWIVAQIFTGWWRKEQFEQAKVQQYGGPTRFFRPFVSLITCHSAVEQPTTDLITPECRYLKGSCHSHESYTLGDDLWKAIVVTGDVWEWLEQRHTKEFGPAPTRPTCEKCNELARLLVEARDALPAISWASAKIRGIDLSLADRIEAALKPWEVPAGTPGAI